MTQNQVMIKMVLDRWYKSINEWDTHLNAITDESLLKEVAPGKNRGIYLLGHLIAVHDDMLVILDMGERLYPELQEPFINAPDKAIAHIPSAKTLRGFWSEQCKVLQQKFDRVPPAEWFEKHSAITAEDFIKEPHRNKLNVVITRIAHLAYHTGQLILLK